MKIKVGFSPPISHHLRQLCFYYHDCPTYSFKYPNSFCHTSSDKLLGISEFCYQLFCFLTSIKGIVTTAQGLQGKFSWMRTTHTIQIIVFWQLLSHFFEVEVLTPYIKVKDGDFFI